MGSKAIVCGLLGKHVERKKILQEWNKFFVSKQYSAQMHYYPVDASTIAVRLSEMFVLQRLLYIVAAPIAELCLPLLDTVPARVPNLIINNNGVLIGTYVSNILDPTSVCSEVKILQTLLQNSVILAL